MCESGGGMLRDGREVCVEGLGCAAQSEMGERGGDMLRDGREVCVEFLGSAAYTEKWGTLVVIC
jgi:hypothetical protein